MAKTIKLTASVFLMDKNGPLPILTGMWSYLMAPIILNKLSDLAVTTRLTGEEATTICMAARVMTPM